MNNPDRMPLTESVKAELRETFRSLDGDKSGAISAAELAESLSNMPGGELMTEEECAQIISLVDKDGDKQLDFEEFLRIVEEGLEIEKRNSQESDVDVIAEEFKNFDVNGDGCIDKAELKSVLKSLGEEPSTDEFEEMFREADVDRDGMITLEEFRVLAQH